MPSSAKTKSRIQERVADLTGHFTEYADYLNQHKEAFVGPSVYFHGKTLALRNASSSASELLQREDFFDYLYATLTAWGLHRMGPGNAKLVDLDILRKSLRSQVAAIQALWGSSLADLAPAELSHVTHQLWGVLSHLQVSIAKAKLVANSKALHHLLPALMPPIDRTYTYTFFYSRNGLHSLAEADAFSEIYAEFHRIASARKAEIHGRIGKGFHTSETKVIDNAIVGYVRGKLRQPASDP
jgi:hypothetical protein